MSSSLVLDKISDDELLTVAIAHASHVLPAQGPIGTFVHHNTLHAFQQLPFHEAIRQATSLTRSRGYLQESQYRQALQQGRIEPEDIEYALALRDKQRTNKPVVNDLTTKDIERLMLHYEVGESSAEGFRWALSEQKLAEEFRVDVGSEQRKKIVQTTVRGYAVLAPKVRSYLEDLLRVSGIGTDVNALLAITPERGSVAVLWAACIYASRSEQDNHLANVIDQIGEEYIHRDLLVGLAVRDPATMTNTELIAFLGAYLDEGMARWSMPQRERGILQSYHEYGSHSFFSIWTRPAWLRRAHRRLDRYVRQGTGAKTIVADLLRELGVPRERWESYITRVLLQLPGWSGMVARLENNPTDRPSGSPPVSLQELLAVRLLLDVEATVECVKELGYRGPLKDFVKHLYKRLVSREKRIAHGQHFSCSCCVST